jgi:hypothetical protein
MNDTSLEYFNLGERYKTCGPYFLASQFGRPTSKQFLKCVDDIKNKAINNMMKPISNALGDITPPILGNTLRKLEYKLDR